VTVPGCFSILFALLVASQEPPSFPSRVENVYVDAFVTHRGEPVRGLTASHFEVRDDGVLKEVRLVSLDVVPVVVLLVFDTSSSVAGDALGHLQAAGHAVLGGLRPGERAALITFNQEVAIRVPPSDDLERLHEALDRLRAFGATSLYDAAYTALTVRVQEGRPMIVLFSDGDDNASWLEAEDVRAVAARADSVLQAVGVGLSPRVGELRRIAAATGGRFWEAEASEDLGDTFLQILDEMRTRYLLTFPLTGAEQGGEHQLEVRLKGAKGKVRFRRSYYVGASSPSR
jgi:VWFA-related protein